MKRVTTRTSLSLLAGALLSLALTWSLAEALAGGVLGSREPATAPKRTSGAAGPRSPERIGVPEDERRAIDDAPAEPVPLAATPADLGDSSIARVRVRGSLNCQGIPVADRDLSFRSVSGQHVEDWDFTDEDGRYEVELHAGTYDVLSDGLGEEVWLARVIVPTRDIEVTLCLEEP